MLVTAAHCTFLCKSGLSIVDNCCCDNIGQLDCSSDTNKCGNNPTVVEMTGFDMEVLCGEWETGATPASVSGEEFNVVLPIIDIIRHPGDTFFKVVE